MSLPHPPLPVCWASVQNLTWFYRCICSLHVFFGFFYLLIFPCLFPYLCWMCLIVKKSTSFSKSLLINFHFIKAASAFCEMMETVLKQTSFFWIRQTWKRKQQREAGSHMEMIFVAERQSHLSCHWGGGGRDYICSKACLLLMKHGLTSLPVTQTDGAAAATAFSSRKQQHHHHLHTSSFQQQEQLSAAATDFSSCSSFEQQLSATPVATVSSKQQHQQLLSAAAAFSSSCSFQQHWQFSQAVAAFSRINSFQQQQHVAAARDFSSSNSF